MTKCLNSYIKKDSGWCGKFYAKNILFSSVAKIEIIFKHSAIVVSQLVL